MYIIEYLIFYTSCEKCKVVLFMLKPYTEDGKVKTHVVSNYLRKRNVDKS